MESDQTQRSEQEGKGYCRQAQRYVREVRGEVEEAMEISKD